METVVTKLPESQVEIKATFDKEEWKAAQKRALRRIAGQVNIPGFRKGKAPLNMVKSRVGSGYIMQEALDMILQDSYQSVFMDNNVQPLTQPTVDAETMNADELVLVFKTTVLPEVTLGDYKGLDVKKEAVEVTDEEIDARIKNIQDQNATYVIREEDDAAQDGDVVVIDYKGSIDGEEFDGGSAENHELTLGSGQFIPGFEDQLVGVKANEEKDVTVTFPEDYMAAD
ncbi:MAG: trigger factor, partial [Erysipelotrichaceae bacterium]|nr:trigger factor [Erysipelotrichaceae bacterium]